MLTASVMFIIDCSRLTKPSAKSYQRSFLLKAFRSSSQSDMIIIVVGTVVAWSFDFDTLP